MQRKRLRLVNLFSVQIATVPTLPLLEKQHLAVGTLDAACCTPETMGKPGCCEPSEKTAGCCS